MTCPLCGMPTDGRVCGNPQCAQYVGSGWTNTSSSPSNDFYLGLRLLYSRVDDRLSGIVTWGMVLYFFRKVAAWWLIALALGIIVTLFFYLIGVVRLGLFIAFFIYLGSYGVFFVTFRVPISGWQFTLDTKAAAADSSFAQICWALQRRASPVRVSRQRVYRRL